MEDYKKPLEDMSDWELVRICLDGNLAALEVLIYRYRRYIAKIATSCVMELIKRNYIEVDDVIDDTWIYVIRRLEENYEEDIVKYPDGIRIIVWGATMNALKKYIEILIEKAKEIDCEELKSILEKIKVRNEPSLWLSSKANIHIDFFECLAMCPEEDQKMFLMRYRDEMKYEDIGKAFGLPAYTIRITRLPRIRQNLKSCMKKKGYTDEQLRFLH